jgi:hypothetical protein
MPNKNFADYVAEACHIVWVPFFYTIVSVGAVVLLVLLVSNPMVLTPVAIVVGPPLVYAWLKYKRQADTHTFQYPEVEE